MGTNKGVKISMDDQENRGY